MLDEFYDGRFTKVDSFDKSLLFSISFTMEGSLLSNCSLICLSKMFTLKFSLIN